MRTIISPFPAVRRLIPTSTGWYTIGLVALLLTLEFLGRTAGSDLHDAIAALALVSAVAIIVARHQRSPLPWVSWIAEQGRRVGKRFEQLKFDHGIDLRGSPAMPYRLPWWTWAIAGGLVGWAGAAATAWYFFPGGWRLIGVQTFYLAYLVSVLVVWLGLIICVAGGLYVPVALLDSWLKSIPREADRRSAELLVIVGYVLSVVAVAVFVPTVVVLGLCLVIAAGAMVLYFRRPVEAPAVLWRMGSGRPVYSIPAARLAAAGIGAIALFVFDLLLTANGGRLFAGEDLPSSMPLTALLGTAAAWLLPGAAILAGGRILAWARNDPSRPTPPTVYVKTQDRRAGNVSDRSNESPPNDDLRKAGELISAWGWNVRLAPDLPRPGDVGIELVSANQSQATEFDPGWPLKVSLADLADGAVRDRLDRRDEIQLRRIINRGLSLLFKQAAGEPGKKRGSGYWFAPHWWFMDSLGREDARRGKDRDPDGDNTMLRPVGPPFTAVFTPRSRQHLYRVFRATEVDLIFIEAGIQHRVVTKVLRQLFEIYDMHAGKKKVEDHHFRGIPKVRVMLHDYAPGSRFEAAGYPEPQFDDLSRARVMHIFRDRGEQEELDEVPFDFSWEPAPALGVG